MTTSGKKTGKKLVRAISAESIYRCMLLYFDHILYRTAHFVRDASRAQLAIRLIGMGSLLGKAGSVTGGLGEFVKRMP